MLDKACPKKAVRLRTEDKPYITREVKAYTILKRLGAQLGDQIGASSFQIPKQVS